MAQGSNAVANQEAAPGREPPGLLHTGQGPTALQTTAEQDRISATSGCGAAGPDRGASSGSGHGSCGPPDGPHGNPGLGENGGSRQGPHLCAGASDYGAVD